MAHLCIDHQAAPHESTCLHVDCRFDAAERSLGKRSPSGGASVCCQVLAHRTFLSHQTEQLQVTQTSWRNLQYRATMAITDLPPELVSTFAAMLPVRDFMNMRAANKVLANKSLDTFKALFKMKTIMLSRPSLESLIAISQDERLADSVRILRITSYAFDVAGLRSGVSLHTVKSLANNSQPVTDNHSPEPFRGVEFSYEQFTAYAALFADELKLHSSGEVVELLAKALVSLRKLRKIKLGNLSGAICTPQRPLESRGILGLKGIGASIGAHNIKAILISSCGVWAHEESLSTALKAVAASKATIHHITSHAKSSLPLGLEDAFSATSLDQPQVLPVKVFLDEAVASRLSFPSVKMLQLQYRSGQSTGGGPYMLRNARNSDVVDVQLEQMLSLFPKLSTLSLHAVYGGTDTLPRFSDSFMPPRLSKLALYELTTGLDDLVRMIVSFKNTLKSLKFGEMNLFDNQWNQLADAVAQMSKLEEVEFIQVENRDGGQFVPDANATTPTSMVPYSVDEDEPSPIWPVQVPNLATLIHDTINGGAPVPVFMLGGALPFGPPRPNTTSQTPMVQPDSAPQTPTGNLPEDVAAPPDMAPSQEADYEPLYNSVILSAPDVAGQISKLPF